MHPYRTRVKVCGITSAADAAAAVDAGADAVGVILAPSPRQVSVECAEEILAEVPPFVVRVGVFVDADSDEVESAISRAGLTAVQLHGSESPEMCARISVPVIKALRVGKEFDVDCVELFQTHVAAVLLDTYDPQRLGGTGKTLAWDAITELSGRAPLILAGGLTSDNVAEAIRVVRPFAVDVSSGVEASPGVKDHRRLFDFTAAVHAADSGSDS